MRRIKMILAFVSKAAAILLTFNLFLFQLVRSQPNFVRSRCTPDPSGNYTANSFYKQSLDLILSELDEKSTHLASYNAKSGTQNFDQAYGLFFCRGDIETKVCKTCVQAATKQLLVDCPSYKNAVIWYQECTLRYYANSSAAFLEDDGRWVGNNALDYVSDPSSFLVKVTVAMSPLINQSAYGSALPDFATDEVTISRNQTLHCLVQCSPYTTPDHCEKCLTRALSELSSCCSNGSVWVMLFNPSCQLRYDFLPFYKLSSSKAAQAPALPPALAVQQNKPSGNNAAYYVTRAVLPAVVVLLLLAGMCLWLRRAKLEVITNSSVNQNSSKVHEVPWLESKSFDLGAMQKATDYFSKENVLGEGGYGIVYRGTLEDGEKVAIKRLSEFSKQGAKEFSTEVTFLTKLLHKNLVRLVGYCEEGKEKLLVYEYLPELSLDKILFDPSKSMELNWTTRYDIIVGTAKAIQYLHHDSPLRSVVHRDLKTGNILMDNEKNPKIADFGLATLIQLDQTRAITSRIIAGTWGYLAPECIMEGRTSVQSDVYSFGAVVLEIVSGQRIKTKEDETDGKGLLYQVWELRKEGLEENILDPNMGRLGPSSKQQAIRCIEIALLCMQNDRGKRPKMSKVLLYLDSESVKIPEPIPPPFITYSDMMRYMDQLSSGSQRPQAGEVYYSATSNSMQI